MDKLYDFFTAVTKPRFEEDAVDRLNYRVSGAILLGAAVTITAGSYIADPLQCWVPKQFADGWEQYVENYCFVENTYWLPFNQSIPRDHMEREGRQLSYYQWVPFILALQALVMNIPHIIWRMLNRLSGIEVRSIITMVSNMDDFTPEKKDEKKEEDEKKDKDEKKVSKPDTPEPPKIADKSIDMVARHLKAGLQLNGSDYGISKHSSNPFRRWTGAYITVVYLAVKILFIISCILQFVMLNAFLGMSNNTWGITLFSDLMADKTWNNTGLFPRVTMCDFEVRELGNIHRHTVQCVLMVNMLSEKIFVFLWCWFAVVAVVTILNFIYWLVTSAISAFRDQFLKRMLNAQGISIESIEEQTKFNRFSNTLVRSDGMVVLRLLARNASDIKASEVVARLWELADEPR